MNMKLSSLKKSGIMGRLVVIGLFWTAVALFVELAGDVWLNEGFAWDAPIMLWVHQWSAPWLDTVFQAITQTAGGWVAVPLAVVTAVLWQQRKKRTAVLIFASFAGSVALNTILKLFFARLRPNIFPPLIIETSFSFPSGHTMAAVAFYGLISILLWRSHRHGWAILPGLWVPLVALSRIYLGVHYPSDVLASLAVGTIWLILMMLLFTRKPAS